MLRKVFPRLEDRIADISDQTWASIEAAGEFFEAKEGATILELGQTDEHLLIVLSGKATLIYFQDGRRLPPAIYRVPGAVLHHAGMHLEIANPFAIEAASDETRVVLISRKTVYKMIGKDTAFAEYLFKDGSMIGLNKDILCQYVEYITNLRMESVGLSPAYPQAKQNPIPWINTWLSSDNVQVAPQEVEISSYLVGQISNDVEDEDLGDFEL